MRKRAMVMVGSLAVGLVALAPDAPAGAAVTVTSSGTAVTAAATGTTTIRFSCVGGSFRVSGVAATPDVTCSALTRVNVTGDSGQQYVFGDDLDGLALPALASTSFLTGGGDDLVWGTLVDDTIWTATGNDQVFLPAAGDDDTNVLLGSETSDAFHLAGTGGDDVIELDTTSGTASVATNGTWSSPFSAAFGDVAAGAGDDTVDASGITTSLVGFSALGQEGDDLLRSAQVGSTLSGGPGANVLWGGPGVDRLTSESTRDTYRSAGGADLLRDTGSGRIGGRVVENTGTDDTWTLDADGDAAIRSRSTGGTGATVTGTLARTGVQALGANVSDLIYDTSGGPADRVLLDLAALPAHAQRVILSPGTVTDLVVPSGSWSVSGSTVSFTGGYQDVIVAGGAPNVRAPFTDPNQRFGHRLIRDLEMRIPTASERNAIRDQLAAGTRTRAQLVLTYTSTDVYRGIDVDRTYIDILRRANDPAGRAYWIERLRDGLHLRKLRANLYGSLEYFNRYGEGDVATYVASAYRDILGRESDPSGLAYWIGLIESGTPKGTVAERFLNTAEAREVLIRDRFLRWVDREPTAGELSTWTTAVASTTSDGEQALVRFLAASAAYYTRPDA